MRKPARTHEEGKRQPSRWIRGSISAVPPNRSGRVAATAPSPKPSGTAKSQKRFIEPFRYDDGQRDAIGAALAAEGLGDETSRDIFVGAIAYDLAVLREAAAAEPVPAASPQDKTEAGTAKRRSSTRTETEAPPAIPEALARSAREVAESLDALADEQRRSLCAALSESDPLGREYGDTFLGAIGRELEHIAGAMAKLASAPQAKTAGNDRKSRRKSRTEPAVTEPSKAVLAFIAHAGNVYLQCFDTPPSADPDAAFAKVLTAIAKTTGISIPVDSGTLDQALQRGSEGSPPTG